MNAVQRAVDVALHPRCITRRTPQGIVGVLLAGMLLAIIVYLLVQQWWVIPIMALVGLSLVVHPLCFGTNHTHKHPDSWWRIW